MKPEHLALALALAALAVVAPSVQAAVEGKGYGGLLLALPVVPFVAFVLYYFVPWAFREDDAQLTRLLELFECGDAADALRGVGVKTITDLEYITPETLGTLGLSIIAKAKLEDALRHAGARGWTKQVFEAKDGAGDAGCKICDRPSSEHHGRAKYCSKRCADAVARLAKMQTPQLYTACREGDDKGLQGLITAGADVNAEDPEGRSPLHCACHWGKGSVVASLISSRANVHAKTNKGLLPIHFAAESGNVECVRLLLKAGVSAKEAAGEARSTPLHRACSKRALQVCELLIQYGADVNAADINGNQPLHESGLSSAEARLLIKHKADVNARDGNRRRPLHKFAYVGNRAVCLALLEANAQVDANDAEGDCCNNNSNRARQ